MGTRTSHKRTAVAALALVLALLASAATSPAGGLEEQPSDLSYDGRLEKVEKLKKKYDRAEPPAEPPKLRWDFSRERTLRYFYSQNTLESTDIKKDPDPPDITFTVEGNVRVESDGKGTARLVLENMTMERTELGEQGDTSDTAERSLPREVVPKMSADSSAEEGDFHAQDMRKMAFPLPDEPLEVGESVRRSETFHVRALGSLLPLKGRLRLTLARYVHIDGQKCAQLHARFQSTELVVPDDREGEYEAVSRGESVYFFSLEEGKFVASAGASVTKMKIEAPVPESGVRDAIGEPGEHVSLTRTRRSTNSYRPAPSLPFAGRLEKMKKKYERTEPPAKTPEFRWDFSRERTLRYAYDQETRSSMDTGGAGPPGGQNMTVEGDMLVKSQGDGTARLVLQDLSMSMRTPGQDGEGGEMRTRQIPTMVVPGLKEDGSADYGSSRTRALLRVLFALPPEPLEVGESVRKPASMPFNASGSPLQVKGHMELTLSRYVRIDGRRCAQLDAQYDISELDVPEEMEGEYDASLNGRAVYFFCPDEGKFMAGATAAVMDINAHAPDMRQTPGGGSMSMTMNTFLRFRPAPPEKKETEGEGAKKDKGDAEAEEEPASDYPENPKEVLRAFFKALIKHDKKRLTRLMKPHDRAEVLWETGEKPTGRQLKKALDMISQMSFEELKPGDPMFEDQQVPKGMVGPNKKVLQPQVSGKMLRTPVPMVLQDGRWKVDASPFIEAREAASRVSKAETETETALSTLRTAQRAYKAANGHWAPSLDVLAKEGYIDPGDFRDFTLVKYEELSIDGTAGDGDGIAQWKGSIEGYELSSRYITADGEFGGSKE